MSPKRAYRAKLKAFIETHYPSEAERRELRVACLPGHEALEVKEVYLPLGIQPFRIYGLEEKKETAAKIEALNLGIKVYPGSALSFFKEKGSRFDVINLDFQSQFSGEEMNTICAINHGERLKRRGILGTNFYGSRESEERQENYTTTFSFFAEGGLTARIGNGIKNPIGPKVVEALGLDRNFDCSLITQPSTGLWIASHLENPAVRREREIDASTESGDFVGRYTLVQ